MEVRTHGAQRALFAHKRPRLGEFLEEGRAELLKSLIAVKIPPHKCGHAQAETAGKAPGADQAGGRDGL